MLPIEYINKNGSELISPNNFNEADLILFATLPLIDISNVGIPVEGEKGSTNLKDILNKQYRLHKREKYGLILKRKINDYLEAAANCDRYTPLKFYNLFYKVDNNTQSVFFMCDISENITIVDFSGTDDTITGWIENLKLLVNQEQECLTNAREYVNRNCTDPNKYYVLVGHSKGGLISNYALLTANNDVKDRIIVAYNLDGPGFSKEFIKKHKNDKILEYSLIFYAPKGSVIGRLFNQFKNAIVVKTSAKGLEEHNPVEWNIDDNFNFIRCRSFSKKSTITDMMIKKYINQLGKKETEDLVNTISKILHTGNKITLTGLFTHPFKLLRATFSLPKAEKKQVLSVPFKLIKLNTQSRKELNSKLKLK